MVEALVARPECSKCLGVATIPEDCDCVVQLLWDSRTLWVNAFDSSNLARFSPRGIDIHRSVQEQLDGGRQCLYCVPADGKAAGLNHPLWNEFKSALKRFHGVEIPDGFVVR